MLRLTTATQTRKQRFVEFFRRITKDEEFKELKRDGEFDSLCYSYLVNCYYCRCMNISPRIQVVVSASCTLAYRTSTQPVFSSSVVIRTLLSRRNVCSWTQILQNKFLVGWCDLSSGNNSSNNSSYLWESFDFIGEWTVLPGVIQLESKRASVGRTSPLSRAFLIFSSASLADLDRQTHADHHQLCHFETTNLTAKLKKSWNSQKAAVKKLINNNYNWKEIERVGQEYQWLHDQEGMIGEHRYVSPFYMLVFWCHLNSKKFIWKLTWFLVHNLQQLLKIHKSSKSWWFNNTDH